MERQRPANHRRVGESTANQKQEWKDCQQEEKSEYEKKLQPEGLPYSEEERLSGSGLLKVRDFHSQHTKGQEEEKESKLLLMRSSVYPG